MKKILLLLLAVVASANVWAADFITDVIVIGGSKSEVNSLKTTYTNQGWTVVDQDLNAGCGSGSDYIYLLYKTASETSTSATFITDFLISTATTPPNSFMNNGRVYYLVSYDGSDYFKNNKGDLNSHCGSGSATIHLYYTKDYADDLGTVRSITFNDTQAGGVPVSGGSTGYDLNTGCGSSSDYIYMHTEKSQGWTYTKNSDGTLCYINGYDGPKANITSITIPTTLDGAQVANFTGSVFSGFTNLETMIFNVNTIVSQMPSVNGLTKFRNVKTSNDLGNNSTPPSMTSIPASTFEGTAVMIINLTAVTSIGNYAFKGCSSLKDVYVGSTLNTIGKQVFYNCSSLSHLWFDGTQAQWNAVSKDSQWRSGAANFTEYWRCTVTFDANGHGTAPAAQTIWCNYDKATEPTAPTTPLGTFQGWYTDAACTNQWNFNTVVTGDMTLYAKWDMQYAFNSTTGELALLWGEFNKDNKWGSDVPASAVKTVTATSQVSFTGNCFQLFYDFRNCTSMDLSRVNTSNVYNMIQMFYCCSKLTSLDLTGWNTDSVTDMVYMFGNCLNLTTIYVSTNWNTENVANSDEMFIFCSKLVGGSGTTYNYSFIDKTYARIDRGASEPGYLTGMFTLTLPSNVTASATPVCTLNGINYYTAGTTVTLTYNGNVPEDKVVTYSVNGATIVGDTFQMPVDDVIITVTVGDPPRYIFDNFTGKLELLWGEFNGENNWGDDVIPNSVTSVTATSKVRFTGDCSRLFYCFSNCTSMDLNRVNTDSVTNMRNMFYRCKSLTSLDLSGWDTRNVTNMCGMFDECQYLDTLNISSWDTGNVTDMREMFEFCDHLKTLDISDWDTRKVTRMGFMFYGCTDITSLDLSHWNTDNVTDMEWMFKVCNSLTSFNLSGWNTSNVTNMEEMFVRCGSLTTIYVTSNWNTGNVTNSNVMFNDCSKLVGGMGTTYDADHVDKEYARIDRGPSQPGYLTGVFTLTLPENVTASPTPVWTLSDTAYYASGTTVTLTYNGEVPEGKVVIYSVNGATIVGDTFQMPADDVVVTVTVGDPPRYLFDSVTGELALLWGKFDGGDYKWGDDVDEENVTSVTATSEVRFTGDCTHLFWHFQNCTSMDLNRVNTDSVTNMQRMFYACKSLTSLDLSGWDTRNVTDMRGMFDECQYLDTLNLSGWNTGNVTDMRDMFEYCWNLNSLDISGWDTRKVTRMGFMFYDCSRLTSLDLSHWNTDSVTDMESMFSFCSTLTSLNLSGWNTSNVTNMSEMFVRCGDLTTIYVSTNWNTGNVTNSNEMFNDCSELVGGMGTTYDADHVDKEYARIDGGPDCPGYFTGKTVGKPGDANGDGTVDVNDVTTTINYILGKHPSPFNSDNANVNGDENVDVMDVTLIINLILGIS